MHALVIIFIVAAMVISLWSVYLQRQTVEMFTTEGTKTVDAGAITAFKETPAPAPANAAPENVGIQTKTNVAPLPNPINLEKPEASPMTIPEGSSPEELLQGKEVIGLYEKVLARVPSREEYMTAVRNLMTNRDDLVSIEQKLYNSPEFARSVKVQSNTTNPELVKVIQDLRLIRTVILMYQSVFEKEPYPSLRLPLKDAYVYLNFNKAAFDTMLRSPNYPKWEESIIANPLVGRIDVEASIEQHFVRDTLMRAGQQQVQDTPIAKQQPVAAAPSSSNATTKTAGSNVALGGGSNMVQQLILARPNVFIISGNGGQTDIAKAVIAAGNVGAGGARPIAESDTNSQPMIDSIQSQGFHSKLYHKKDDLVLRPEFAWSVPTRQPPVCTNPPGAKQVPVSPVLEGSKLLLGTPIGEAQDTGVGSIMPKFEFKEYSEVEN